MTLDLESNYIAMDRAFTALRLEAPESVCADVEAKANAVVKSLEQQLENGPAWENYRNMVDAFTKHKNKLEQQLAAERATSAVRVNRLITYTVHKDYCNQLATRVYDAFPNECTCGLNAIAAELAEDK